MTVSIRTRIILAIGLCLVLISSILFEVFYEHSKVEGRFLALDNIIKKIDLTSQLQKIILTSLVPGKDYFLLIQDEEKETEWLKQFTDKTESLVLDISSMHNSDGKAKALLTKINELNNHFAVLGEKILALKNPLENKLSSSLIERFEIVGYQINLLIEKLQLLHEHQLDIAYQETANIRNVARQNIMMIGVLSFFLVLIFGVHLVRAITRPIIELVKGTNRLKNSDWEYRVNIQTGDELERLADNFNDMAEKLSEKNHVLEEEVRNNNIQLTERTYELEALLLTSADLSAELDIEQLLKLMAQRLTNTLKVTYCRIAMIDEEHTAPVIRAAYPIRVLDWEPGIGRELNINSCPDIQKVLETARYVIVSHDTIVSHQIDTEIEQVFTAQTQSALIFPLIIKGRPEGVIILGEARIWDREPFSQEKIALCQTLINQAIIAIENAENYSELQTMFFDTTCALSSAIDAKSHWTQGHSERMTNHAMRIGQQLGLDSDTLSLLQLGCTLHDIGKIGTYESILNKVEKLTADDIEIIKQHPIEGERILKSIHKFKKILPIVRNHHERYDGTGYPDGLKGEEIPLLARIAALADTYDAMRADRPYRKGCSHSDAIAEIKRCSGTQFDPTIAAAFIILLENGYQ